MKKIPNVINKIINKFYIVLLIILVSILSLTITQSINIDKLNNGVILSPFILIIISIVYIFLIVKIKQIISRKIKNNSNKTAIILCIIFLILLMISSLIISCIPHKDLINIVIEAKNLVSNNTILDINYFSKYTNNLGLLYFISFIYKLANFIGIGYNNFAYLINSIFVSATAYFIYLSIKEVSNKENALTFLIFFIINPILYLYITYYYTDLFVMPFMSITIYLILRQKNNKKNNWKKILDFILIGILGYIGYKIRATAIFIIIAYLITLLFKKDILESLKKIVLIFIGLVIGTFTFSIIENGVVFNVDNNTKYPSTHWIMMGVNKYSSGQWSSEDTIITSSELTYKEKKDKNISEIKTRINNMNLRDIKDLFVIKNRINWAYGDSAYASNFKLVNNINRFYEYIVGNKTIIISYILQANRIVLYTLLLVSIVYELSNKKRKLNFIVISVFGAFLFYIFWEVAPRYALCFLPVFIIMIGYNFDKITNLKLKKLEIEYYDKKINIDPTKIINILKVSIIIITIVNFIFNYDYYAIKKENYSTKTVYSFIEPLNGGTNIEYIKENKVIEQTFKSNKNFNSIIIKIFKKNNIKGSILLELLDSENKVLYRKFENLEYLNNNDYISYKLPTTYKKNNYKIKIRSNITEDENLGVYILDNKDYDYMTSGEMIIDNVKTTKDLQMNINNKVYNSIISKRVYILIAFLSIIIELFAFGYIDKLKIKKVRSK